MVELARRDRDRERTVLEQGTRSKLCCRPRDGLAGSGDYFDAGIPGKSCEGADTDDRSIDGGLETTNQLAILANGDPISDWTPARGTYHVDANCTGTMTLHPGNGGFVNLRIVIVRNGKEIHALVWPPYDGPARVVTSVGIKVE